MARGHSIRFALLFVLGLHACAYRAKVPVAELGEHEGEDVVVASDQHDTILDAFTGELKFYQFANALPNIKAGMKTGVAVRAANAETAVTEETEVAAKTAVVTEAVAMTSVAGTMTAAAAMTVTGVAEMMGGATAMTRVVAMATVMTDVADATKDKLEVCNDSLAVKGSEVPMPARGFITCCNFSFSKSEMLSHLTNYLKAGGRLIDTAPDYHHEDTVGEAILAAGIPREKLWISTKVDTDGWRGIKGSPSKWVLAQVDKSLKAMHLSYVDSMVLHFGIAQVAMEAKQPVELNATKIWRTIGPAEHVEMWRGLMQAKRQGKVRNIGVCETTRKEIENLIQETGETPSMVVTWVHPWMPKVQLDFVSWAQSKEMAVVAYGLFNFKYFPFGKGGPNSSSNLLRVQAAEKAGKKHNVTWGQIAIKWARDQGVGFLTGLYHPEYLEEDLPCLDGLHLDAEDHATLAEAPPWECKDQYTAHQFFPGCIP